MRKPKVWLVEDLKAKREEFCRMHGDHFQIEVFVDPIKVLERLRAGGRPDALLCDIYFFPNSQATNVEQDVEKLAARIQKLEKNHRSQEHEDGIALIEQIQRDFEGKAPFPVYAYTSKGPYLLEKSGFGRISQCEARWLFKGKHTRTEEYNIVRRGIAEVTKSAKKVFVVHGRNTNARRAVTGFLEHFGLKPVVLSEEPDRGSQTIIEKFEKHSDVGFAVVLLTGDDVGKLKGEHKPEVRARQNVILELGFFLGRLGRDRVSLLYETDVKMPSDFDGVLYKNINCPEQWQPELTVELRNAGLLLKRSEVPSATRT